jgi:PilZ domain
VNLSFHPTVGQVALIEPDDPASAGNGSSGAATGVVASGRDGALNLIGVAWPHSTDSSRVVVSIFAPDALYRLRATAHWGDSGQLAIEPIHDVERIQRRRWPRHPLRLGVRVAPDDADGGDVQEVDGWTLDVSMGGLRVRTNGHLLSGADQTVVLTLPDGMPLSARATIVAEHIGDSGDEYRLAFDALDESGAGQLTALVGEPADPGSA